MTEKTIQGDRRRNALNQSDTQIPKNLRRLSWWMDNSIVLPGGYRIGWDAIIGLIPGVGDFTGLAISLYIIAGAYRAGATLSVLLRMLLNVGIESIVGVIPIVGDIFDMAFKANIRNMQLLEHQYADPSTLSAQSRNRIWLIVLTGMVFLSITLYASVTLLLTILRQIF